MKEELLRRFYAALAQAMAAEYRKPILVRNL